MFVLTLKFIFITLVVNFTQSFQSYRNIISKSKEHYVNRLSLTQFDSHINQATNFLSSLINRVPVSIVPIENDFNEFFRVISNDLVILTKNPITIPIFTLGVFMMVLAGFGSDDESIGSPYTVGENFYSTQKADEFYGSRPLYVFRRLFKLARLTLAFNVKLASDFYFDKVTENQKIRAKEALELITVLGPTFIKLGQVLSIRTDLIPEDYALELRQLQDAVPPFSSVTAKEIMKEELKVKKLDEIFEKISDKPIASASIGQVYKATMKDGREVAIKVQRPNIIKEIALDLYILRLITPIQVKLTNYFTKRKTDQADIDLAVSLVDEWGRGFVAEVDYRLEAKNGQNFMKAMKARGLNAVISPEVIEVCSASRIITTQWIDGTRLDRDASADVPRLCGVAINAYLTMLLDTGVLHCE